MYPIYSLLKFSTIKSNIFGIISYVRTVKREYPMRLGIARCVFSPSKPILQFFNASLKLTTKILIFITQLVLIY